MAIGAEVFELASVNCQREGSNVHPRELLKLIVKDVVI